MKLTAAERRALDELAQRRGLRAADLLREGLRLVFGLEALVDQLAASEGEPAAEALRASLRALLALGERGGAQAPEG